MTSSPCPFILCADDFALNAGISDGIAALAKAGRLSATSAMVTSAHWPERARTVDTLRSHLAVGLHINLTFGAPLGVMPGLAPDGDLPPASKLIGMALRGALDLNEIGAEIGRQIECFESLAGVPPDFVDGHHHAHILPGIRRKLMDQLSARYRGRQVLVRNPADRPGVIVRRRTAAAKALSISALAAGMGRHITAAGFLANNGFSGFSAFGAMPYNEEFRTFLVARSSHHIIMCHPGWADPQFGEHDEIAARRPQEYEALARWEGLPDLIWHPTRPPGSDAPAFAARSAA
jgi:predicted glycoside hydrolase/deacetylase ChbG (UPF0249 family)